ncbi:hypothetical protein PROVRETT_07111 [Providencia rettgeri DSM 1131]|nr:hypothetical protein PROVRETT_07111 [Providencia rettgeri DSM 1131]
MISEIHPSDIDVKKNAIKHKPTKIPMVLLSKTICSKQAQMKR